jgi:protein-L-isoaspartate(D-aspartate) O-methyltransferase
MPGVNRMMGLFSKSRRWDEEDFRRARLRMVANQIAGRDVKNPEVLKAMERVPRHLFVEPALRHEAYDDNPLPIGYGQTISQPYVVASMTEHLQPSREKTVLEIGTGSGYQTAVLAELFKGVDTVEYVTGLSQGAQKILKRLGYANVTFHIGDGLLIPSHDYSFDAIIVTAAPEKLPETLVKRLNPGGRLIIPVGSSVQDLQLISLDARGQIEARTLYPVRFVPLLGDDS